jgi:hypothetical protein
MEASTGAERRQALQEAKQAVRAYAREPSQANADAVEMAWRKVRQLDSLAQWRQAGSDQADVAALVLTLGDGRCAPRSRRKES